MTYRDYKDVSAEFVHASKRSLSDFRKESRLSLKRRGEEIVQIVNNTALTSMEICRLLNGISLDDYDRCYRGSLRKFTYETLPQRCSFIENKCRFWSLDVFNQLRRMQKAGVVKSALLRWFNKRGRGKLDKFRFWFTDPENLRERLLRDARKLRKILLIIPCNKYAEVGNYKLGRNWKMVLKRIEPWREGIDLAATDCINMLGLVPEWENYKTAGHNIYPSWEHFKNNPERLEKLARSMAKKLEELAPRYDRIIAYLNVKAYLLALKKASHLSKIKVEFVEIDLNPISYAKNLPKLIETISINGS